MHSRRSILASLGLFALAGCTAPPAQSGDPGGGGARGGGPEQNASVNRSIGDAGATNAEAATDTDDPAGEPGGEPTVESRGPVRAEHDAVPSVRTEEDDETVELTDDGEVRFVAAWRHTNRDEIEEGEPPEREPVYDTSEWERWAEIQAVSAASEAAAEFAADELGVERVGGAVSSSVDGGQGVDAVVSTSTTLNRDGDVVSESAVAFEDLVAATPRAVDVTYVLAEREYETTVPVYVRHTVMQYD